VIADGDRITAFGKGISLDESAGESIGIERISGAAGQSIFARLTEAFAQGLVDRYYEDHYGDLIREGKLSAQAVDVGDLPWTEVDDHQDLAVARTIRSEEHTSELQSRENLVCRLLLEKKRKRRPRGRARRL